MKRGTKSILFGVHQFLLHPLFVLRAWFIIYRSMPTLAEFMAILTHDLGYWGMPNMDGAEGSSHPARSAAFWRGKFGSFGNEVADIIIGHSRFHAAANRLPLSKLFQPDKLSTALYPRWLYLLLGNLTGEIKEYMYHYNKGLYTGVTGEGQTQTQWLIEIQGLLALIGLKGEDHYLVAEQMKEVSASEGRKVVEQTINDFYLDQAIHNAFTPDTCRVCGCTDDNACPGGCSWIEPDLCSQCVE